MIATYSHFIVIICCNEKLMSRHDQWLNINTTTAPHISPSMPICTSLLQTSFEWVEVDSFNKPHFCVVLTFTSIPSFLLFSFSQMSASKPVVTVGVSADWSACESSFVPVDRFFGSKNHGSEEGEVDDDHSLMMTMWWTKGKPKYLSVFLHTNTRTAAVQVIILFLAHPQTCGPYFVYISASFNKVSHVAPLLVTSCFIILVNQTIVNGENGREKKSAVWSFTRICCSC